MELMELMETRLKCLYSSCIHVVYMAKLYWRVKVNGKWTWRAVEQRPYVNDEGREFVAVPAWREEE